MYFTTKCRLMWQNLRERHTLLKNLYINSAGHTYPSTPCELDDAANSSADWLSSPILGFPDWPADDQLNEAYTTSPISSPGLYARGSRDSRDYFDDNFKESIRQSPVTGLPTEPLKASFSPYPQAVLQSTWEPNLGQTKYQRPDSSYVPLSLIHDPVTRVNDDNDDDVTEGTTYPFDSSIDFRGENSPSTPFKGSWESSKESKRHSRSSKRGRHSSRIKEKDQQTPHKGSSSSASKGHRLRSTKKGHRINYSEKDDFETIESTKGSKTSHNMVEKQYRTRLNGQFSNLLGALPPDLVGAEVDGYGRDDAGAVEKKVSKAEVLMLAKRHIETLEQERIGLEGSNKVLVENMSRLRGAWMVMGGRVLP